MLPYSWAGKNCGEWFVRYKIIVIHSTGKYFAQISLIVSNNYKTLMSTFYFYDQGLIYMANNYSGFVFVSYIMAKCMFLEGTGSSGGKSL